MDERNTIDLFTLLYMIILVSACFLIIRNYFKNYSLRNDKYQFNKRLRVIVLISGITTVLFFYEFQIGMFEKVILSDSAYYFAENWLSGTMLATAYLFSYFGEPCVYFIRVFCLILMILSICGLVIGYTKENSLISFISLLLGIFSNNFIVLEFVIINNSNSNFILNNQSINICGLLSLAIYTVTLPSVKKIQLSSDLKGMKQ